MLTWIYFCTQSVHSVISYLPSTERIKETQCWISKVSWQWHTAFHLSTKLLFNVGQDDRSYLKMLHLKIMPNSTIQWCHCVCYLFKFCNKSIFSLSLELTFMSKYHLQIFFKFTSNTSVPSLSIAVGLDFNQIPLSEQNIYLGTSSE